MLCSSCLTCCFVPLVQLAALLLLFNLLFYSSCLTCFAFFCLTCCFLKKLFHYFYLTCYSAPFVQHVASFLLLDMLLHSSCLLHSFCSTCYSTPFVQHATPLLLLDLLLCSSCLTCFVILAQPAPFLLLSMFHSSCSTSLFKYLCTMLMILLFHSSCLTSLFTYLSATPMILFLLVPSARPYYFAPLFQVGTSPPFLFLSVACGGAIQI